LEPLLAGDPEVTALTALPTEDQVAMEMLGLDHGIADRTIPGIGYDSNH